MSQPCVALLCALSPALQNRLEEGLEGRGRTGGLMPRGTSLVCVCVCGAGESASREGPSFSLADVCCFLVAEVVGAVGPWGSALPAAELE